MARLAILIAAITLFTACGTEQDTATASDWSETSFTDERGMQWTIAVSTVETGNLVDVQGWAGLHNTSGAPMLIEGVRNCAYANPVELRAADGTLVEVDPFLDGNVDLVDDLRCGPMVLSLAAGETLWVSSVTWAQLEPGTYEMFGSFWNGKAAAIRFDI